MEHVTSLSRYLQTNSNCDRQKEIERVQYTYKPQLNPFKNVTITIDGIIVLLFMMLFNVNVIKYDSVIFCDSSRFREGIRLVMIKMTF